MSLQKVCIFTETYYPVIGGGETQARLLAERLVRAGFSVIILTRWSDSSLKKREQYGEITVYRLPPVGTGQMKKWGLIFTSLPILLKLRKQYDLIFISGFRIIGLIAVPLCRFLKKVVVLKADSQGEMSGDFFEAGLARIGLSASSLPFRFFLRLRNVMLKRAHAFTAITSDVAAELVDSGVNAQDIHMIPNSVDTNRFFPVTDAQKPELRRKLGLPLAGQIVIYTGRLVSYKGLPLLLRVWQALVSEHDHVYLLLVGTGGLDIHNCEAELRSYVAANDLERSVAFTGSVQNVPEYLQASDIFALPTENDAFPSSLVEAMACCLPVVTTPVGAIGTVIQDRHNGLLVEPGNFEQLHAALDALLSDSSLAARLGRAGWQGVQERYSAETVTRQYIQLFHQLSSG
jgi:glycosyltransferase involved in cell wall biosynthesis